MRGRHKKKSLKTYIMTSLVCIILLQTLICLTVILVSGTTTRLNESTMQILDNTVEARAALLEEFFADAIDISSYYEAVTGQMEWEADRKNTSVSEYLQDEGSRRRFLTKMTPTVLSALRNSGVTASFLILDDGTGSAEQDAVYLRDINPTDNPGNNTDIYVEVGDRELLYEYELTLDSLWTPKIDTELCSFYRVTYDAGNEYKNVDAMGLGNISMPVRIHEGDAEVLTYTVPLLDENHQSYGVIGVGVSLSYLTKLLPSSEITIDEMGSYFLGVTQDFEQVQNVAVGSSVYHTALKSGGQTNISQVVDKYDIYHLNADGLQEETSASVCKLNLYNNNSPFENQQWILCGVVRDSKLYASSRLVSMVIVVSLISSFTIALLGTFFMVGHFVKPIRQLVKGIKELTPGYGTLQRTGIDEFDGIASAMEKQNVAVFKAGGKMADIIDNSQIPLGVCDFSIREDLVFCTHNVFDIFEVSDEDWKNNYVPRDMWTKRFKEIRPCFEKCEDEDDIWLYRREDHEPKWIQVKKIVSEEGELYVFHDVTKNMLERKKIMHDRDYDVLTNLYNRRAFAREMQYLVDEGHCKNGILSIWDLDNLKYANDTYGHDIGDKYICMLANVFKRKFNVKHVCARLSGDEFTFFVYDAPYEELQAFLEELHKTLMRQKLYMPDGTDLMVSASVGMARYAEDAVVYRELLRCADYAMYQMKKTSKGNIGVFDRDHYMRNYILLQGVGELNRILEEETIRYAFQPIVSMEDRSVFGYEALIRPISDILGRPDELLRVAESESKLGQIEHITWFHALSEFFGQLKEGDKARLFVNSLPDQVLPDKDWRTLEQMYGDELGCVVMEITEGAKSDTAFVEKKRQFCKRWSIPLAMDDYGAGYSNNDVLMKGHFQFVKLDMGLIRNIHKSPSVLSFVRGMVEYCHENGLVVIAEGIEIEEEYNVLKEMGIDYGQGFFFARPNFSLYP